MLGFIGAVHNKYKTTFWNIKLCLLYINTIKKVSILDTKIY